MLLAATAPNAAPRLGEPLEILHTDADSPAATSLIAGLLADSTARVGAEALADFDQAHRTGFAPWLNGDVLVVREGDDTVAGGAFRRYDSTTAQLDWLWTRPDRRRTGLARRVIAELEQAAIWRGYQRAYAVAGPRQPEVRALLPGSGYSPLGSAGQEALTYLGFVKTLAVG